jgi:hypothetical protein
MSLKGTVLRYHEFGLFGLFSDFALWISSAGIQRSPYLQPKLAIISDQFKISPVRGNQAGSLRPGRQRYQHIQMKIAEFIRRKALFRPDPGKYLPRFQSIFFPRGKDGMVFAQLSQESLLLILFSPPPEFSQNHG